MRTAIFSAARKSIVAFMRTSILRKPSSSLARLAGLPGSIARSTLPRSSAVSRVAGGSNGEAAGAGLPSMTMAPESLPRYFSKSASDPISTSVGVPRTTPGVLDVQASG